MLADLLSAGKTFFDVGANVGFYTVMAARRVGPTGSVVAFEPSPDNVQSLRLNLEMNQFENVIVEQVAVSREAGQATLDHGGSLGATLVSSRVTATSISVPTVTLDLFVQQSGLCPDVVKIDVEGHEVSVIEGMRNTLAEGRPAVVAEMHGRNTEFVAAFDGLGYRLTAIDDPRTVEKAPWWVHVLCLPAELP